MYMYVCIIKTLNDSPYKCFLFTKILQNELLVECKILF